MTVLLFFKAKNSYNSKHTSPRYKSGSVKIIQQGDKKRKRLKAV